MEESGHGLAVGWHPDPTGRFEYRFFNGQTWTADVSTGGERLVDVATRQQEVRRDGRATAALVLGIVGLTLSWIPVVFVVGGICALLGVVFGARARRHHRDSRGFATAGIVTGAAGIALLAVGVFTTRVVVDAVDRFENPPTHHVQITTCAASGSTLSLAGTLENLGSRSSGYRVVVDTPGRSTQPRRVVIPVDDVEPGAIAEFTRSLEIGAASGIQTCEVVDVTGPLPLGINLRR